MRDTKRVLEVANYIITKKATIDDTAKHFNISRRTVQYYINDSLYKLKEKDEEVKSIYNQVKNVLKENEISHHIKNKGIDYNVIISDMINYHLTISDVANKYNISVSSIKKYIAKIKAENTDLYHRLEPILLEKQKVGRQKGGKTSVRGYTYTEEEIKRVIRYIISSHATLEDASLKFNIPTSTIYERIMGINDDDMKIKLDQIFYENKRM